MDNVHIRYEDMFRVPGVPNKNFFNFGVRIENTTIQTTNAQWVLLFINILNVIIKFVETNFCATFIRHSVKYI